MSISLFQSGTMSSCLLSRNLNPDFSGLNPVLAHILSLSSVLLALPAVLSLICVPISSLQQMKEIGQELQILPPS